MFPSQTGRQKLNKHKYKHETWNQSLQGTILSENWACVLEDELCNLSFIIRRKQRHQSDDL